MTQERDDKDTVAMRREELLGLVAETVPVRSHAHTVRRDALAAGSHDGVDVATTQELALDDDSEGVSPTLVLGIIALLLVVFVAVVRLS